jgi:hypothetical protein
MIPVPPPARNLAYQIVVVLVEDPEVGPLGDHLNAREGYGAQQMIPMPVRYDDKPHTGFPLAKKPLRATKILPGQARIDKNRILPIDHDPTVGRKGGRLRDPDPRDERTAWAHSVPNCP